MQRRRDVSATQKSGSMFVNDGDVRKRDGGVNGMVQVVGSVVVSKRNEVVKGRMERSVGRVL